MYFISLKETFMKLYKRIVIILLIIITILVIAFLWYVNDFYTADSIVDDLISSHESRLEIKDNLTIISANQPSEKAIVFYPGGKVEAQAYLPLLLQLSDQGITSILVEMPFNLAVFDIDAAAKAMEAMPDIDQWYLMGHSLGGAMASQYTEEAYGDFEGLILLGAYPVNDAKIDTLAIYGTYDIKLDLKKVSAADVVYEIIGGNHAYFGNYGEQEGDGQARISREDQQAEAVKYILEFINK